MPKTFDDCTAEDLKILDSAMRRFHGRLVDVGTTVKMRYIVNQDKDGESVPCLKVRGRNVVAVAKINSMSDRHDGKQDVTLTICKYTWDERDEQERLAILDNLLTGLDLYTDEKTGAVIRDDLSRPRLKKRLPDFEIAGFDVVADRHGPKSMECQAVAEIASAAWIQGALPFSR